MSDETAAEGIGTETTEMIPEGVEATADAPDEDQALLDALTDAPEGEDGDQGDSIEFDFGGLKKSFRAGDTVDSVAGDLQEYATNLHRDYTEKTTTLAEQRKTFETDVKALEDRAAAFDKLETMQGEAFGLFSQGLQLKGEIEQYNQALADGALWQSNPDQARRISDAISQKSAELSSIQQQYQAKEGELNTAKATEHEKRMQQGRETVMRDVPGFNADEVMAYAQQAYGLSREAVEQWPLNPTSAQMAYKAMKWDQLQAKARQQPKKPARPARPARGNAQRASSNLNDGRTSSKDWFAQREKELREGR